MWQAEILTLFPAMVTGYLEASILGKARTRGLLRVEPRDIRARSPFLHCRGGVVAEQRLDATCGR